MSNWRHFTRDEFKCRGTDCCGGANHIVDAFVDRLDELRERCGFTFPVSSGYRCPIHNQRVSGTGPRGPHTTGMACDIAVAGERAHRLVSEALAMGFTGIGVNQKGSGRFVHLDDLGNGPGCPRPRLWSY